MQQLKDEELMVSYQKGQVQAMDEMLRRYKEPIYRFAFRICANATEAGDIAQEVFFRLHLAKDRYRPSGRFSTWLFSIAHNLAVSRLRKNRFLVLWPRKGDQEEELVEFESQVPSPRQQAIGNEMAVIVQDCIKGLPLLQKEALILREYENFDYQEIARILKKSLGTVKTLIYRARENLKNKLLPYVKEFKEGSDE
jgi:RNA polymerase sigma-70 factor (ECF subfamily)